MTEYKRWKAISNETAVSLLGSSSLEVICKLGQIMEDRSINQTELSILTGIRQATINDIIHNKKLTINKEHTKILMLVLKLTDINQLYEVRFSNPEEKARIEEEAKEVEGRGLTEEQDRILSEHRKKAD